MIENNVKIFDFDYPFYSSDYKPTFEQHFIDHFYYDEIGQETIARFKHRLKVKLNTIMPYWNKIFLADELEQRILDNYDVTETFEKEGNNKTVATSENTTNTNSNNTNKNLFTDTPISKSDVDNVDYFTSITKDLGNANTTSNGNTTNDVDEAQLEKWTRKMTGNIGVQTDSDAIVKYWQSLRKIEEEIFRECDDLFMGVY